MTKTTTKTVSFSIDGGWVANLARTKFKEGDYLQALEILDTLEGLGLEQQISILKGDLDLKGVNEIYLEQPSEKIKKDMSKFIDKTYGTLLYWKKKFWKPVKIISSWGIEDLPKNTDTFNNLANSFSFEFNPESQNFEDKFGANKLLGVYQSRTLHYANDIMKSVALNCKFSDFPNINVNNNFSVIFEETVEQIPHFVIKDIPIDPFKTLKNFFKHKLYIHYDGNHIHYENKNNSLEQHNLNEIKDNDFESENFNEIKPKSNKLINTFEYDDEYWNNEEKKLKEKVQKIKEFADNDKEYGWIYAQDADGHELKIPKRAFLYYAHSLLKIFDQEDQTSKDTLPPYSPFLHSGLKLTNDNVYHTESWLGAVGLNEKDVFNMSSAYDMNSWQYKLFNEVLFQTQNLFLNKNDFNIIHKANKEDFTGIVVSPYNYNEVPKGQRILILPNLSIEYEQAFFDCDYIITETGGKLSHLATLSREFNKNIIRIADATLKFLKTQELTIDIENLTIQEKQQIKEIKKKKIK